MINNDAISPFVIASFVISAISLLLVILGWIFYRKRFALAITAGLPLAILALAGSFATYRFRNAGLWLPPVPDSVGNWKAVDTPIAEGTLAMLGSPKARGHEYTNRFGETVYSTLVCAGPFQNYHDPTVCVVGNGFPLSAKNTIPMGIGNWNVRAMIFKRATADGDVRIMMYYWTQTRSGETATEARMGNFRDMFARLQTGYSAVIKGDQNVIVRIYTIIPRDDINGVQSQRNLNEICRATYKMLVEDGAAKRK